MGATLSTLAGHVFRMNLNHETVIGLLLAIPFFMQFYKESLDRYASKDGRTLMNERVEQYEREHIQKEVERTIKLKHRSLLCGTIPDLAQSSSQDSVMTAIVNNTTRAVQQRELEREVDEDVFILPRMVTAELKNEEREQMSPLHSPSLRVLPDGIGSQIVDPLEVQPEMTPSSSYSSSSSSSSCLTPLDTQFFGDSIDPSSTSPMSSSESSAETYMSHTDYVESVARSLAKKASHADHSDKVGIATALMELGSILANDEKNASALKVFKRAEVVQRILIDETIASVASAMDQLAKHHEKHGNHYLAHLYGNMANELKGNPSPTNLKKTIQIHQGHKVRQGFEHENCADLSCDELRKLNKKLDRRIKRASTEAMPLVQNLREQAKCSSQLSMA